MERLSLQGVASKVQAIEAKIKVIEQMAIDAAQKLDGRLVDIETTNKEILDVVKTAKTFSRFARRWAGPVIASAATAGFFNPKFTAFLTALFA